MLNEVVSGRKTSQDKMFNHSLQLTALWSPVEQVDQLKTNVKELELHYHTKLIHQACKRGIWGSTMWTYTLNWERPRIHSWWIQSLEFQSLNLLDWVKSFQDILTMKFNITNLASQLGYKGLCSIKLSTALHIYGNLIIADFFSCDFISTWMRLTIKLKDKRPFGFKNSLLTLVTQLISPLTLWAYNSFFSAESQTLPYLWQRQETWGSDSHFAFFPAFKREGKGLPLSWLSFCPITLIIQIVFKQLSGLLIAFV